MKKIKTTIIGLLFVLLACAPRALAAQEVTDAELLDLSRTVYAECVGEETAGRKAVVWVILERERCEGFPKTLSKVLSQKCAFSCRNGRGSKLYNKSKKFELETEDASWQQVVRDVRTAVKEGVPLYAKGVVMYKEIHVKRFNMQEQPVFEYRVKNHNFYSLKG